MKKLLFTLALCLCSMLHVPCSAYAQTIPPPYINYQAVLYDVNGANPNNPLINQSFSTFVNINDELGNLLYREEHYASTDANGLITVKIGDGAYVAGSFSNLNDINWGVGKYYLVVDFIINGVTSSTAPEQLVTVPYSYYAGKAGNGMTSVLDNGDGTLTFNYANGTTYTTDPLIGLQGNSVSTPPPAGVIKYDAEGMFYTPSNFLDGDLVVSTTQTMQGIYNFDDFRLTTSGIINIGSNAFLLIKADTVLIEGTINGVGLHTNFGTGGGASGGGGGIAFNAAPCNCSGPVGLGSGLANGFEQIQLLNGGNGGGSVLGSHNGFQGNPVNMNTLLTCIDNNATLKGAKGVSGCTVGGCSGASWTRPGGNGGAGLIIVANYFQFISSGTINLSGANGTIAGSNGGGSGGGGGSAVVKANQYGVINGNFVSNGGTNSSPNGLVGYGGSGGAGMILYIAP